VTYNGMFMVEGAQQCTVRNDVLSWALRLTN